MSDSSLELEFEDIDEGTVVPSVVPSVTVVSSSLPPQIVVPDDSLEVDDSDLISELSENPSVQKRTAISELKERTLDFGSISSFPHGMPTLNRQTIDSNTYDLDCLSDLKVQKRAQGSHRFALSPPPVSRPKNTKNFVARNRGLAGKFGLRVPVRGFTVYNQSKSSVPIDVQERFWDKAAKTQMKLSEFRREKEQEEIADCTFTPRTNLISPFRRRSNSEFADSIEDFLKTRASKIEELRRDQFSLTVDTRPFTPSLCTRSRVLTEKRGASACSFHERLSRRKRSVLEMKLNRLKDQEVFSYMPTINTGSTMLSRSQSVNERLTNKGLRSVSSLANAPAKAFKAPKTDRILISKLIADFEAATDHIEGSRLNYTQAKDVMAKLSLSPAEGNDSVVQMWKALESTSHKGTTKQALLQFLGAALRIEVPCVYIDSVPPLSSVLKAKISQDFPEFYRYKTAVVESQKRLADKFVSPSFKPEINRKSRKLKDKAYSARQIDTEDISIGTMLHNEHEKTQRKIEAQRKDTELLQNSLCTFKPELIARPASSMGGSYRSETLYQHSKEQLKNRAEKRQLTQALRELKETEGCTFEPAINDTFVKSKGVLPEQAKAIERLRTARAERQAVEAKKEKGMTPRPYRQGMKMLVDYTPKQASLFSKPQPSKLSHMKKSSFASPSISSSQSTGVGLSRAHSLGSFPTSSKLSRVPSLSIATMNSHSSLLSPAEEEEIILSLKVNISPTISDVLTIHEGEDSHVTVEAFIAKHRIPEKESAKLRKYVESNIAAFA